jgi:hypothetical protein
MKDVWAPEETYNLKREHLALLNIKLFFIFVELESVF